MKSGTNELVANVSTDTPRILVSQLPASTDYIVTVRSGVGAFHFNLKFGPSITIGSVLCQISAYFTYILQVH